VAAAAASGAEARPFAQLFASVVPHRLAAPRALRRKRQTAAADGHDVARGGGVLDEARFAGGEQEPLAVAVVAGGGGDDHAWMVHRREVLAGLGAAPGVRDLVRPQRGGRVLGGEEVAVGGRAGLDEQDLAGGA